MSNTCKYYKQKKQVSNDGGQTWQDVYPLEYRRGELYETDSRDCGYIPPTPPSPYNDQYLTFVAKEDGTFKFSGTSISNTVEYSLDSGSTWTTLARNTSTPTVSSGQKIMWKGNLTPTLNGIGTFSSACGYCGTSTMKFSVEGNVMSLLYGDDFEGQTDLSGKNNAFKDLFSGCAKLVSAENLCLPATTLTQCCYQSMFNGCTSLTTVPQLPATTLAYQCYSFMFRNCKSLTTVPNLPATTLAHSCYQDMFKGCTSLTSVPSNLLHATTLSNVCYSAMFEDCTSLTTAPELPATTLPHGCYNCMFQRCSSLNYIKCLATDISDSSCTFGWVTSVSSDGTGIFVKASSMTGWPSGTSGIPNGWTVQNA